MQNCKKIELFSATKFAVIYYNSNRILTQLQSKNYYIWWLYYVLGTKSMSYVVDKYFPKV